MRHGESSFNVERRVQGHCDLSLLTEAGRSSALQVGTALQEISPDAIYSSPLKRARATADLILERMAEKQPHLPALQTSDDLKEIYLANWEGLLFSEIKEKYPDDHRHWVKEPHKLRLTVQGPQGPEDFFPVPAVYEQARRFWEAVLPHHEGQTILIVAHSGINRALINTAIGLGPDAYQTLHQSNCGISVLNFAAGLGSPVQIESLNLTAHLGETLPKPRPGHHGPRLLLVRHGETDWNRQKRFQGQIDVPLNENGRRQSAQAQAFLRSVPLDGAFSSPMLRPKETAEIILQPHGGVALSLLDDLREISHGLWEGKLEEEINQEYPGLLLAWQQAPETVQMPEGENLQQVWERAIAGWQAIVKAAAALPNPSPTVLVVAHDAINKAILCYLAGLGPESFWRFKQGNGAVSVIDYPHGSDGPPIIMAANITIHLGGVLDKTAAGAL